MEDGACKEICGKGSIISTQLECDDGDLVNGDGCNDQCEIEEEYICDEDENQLSHCITISSL